jgi:regulator of protease activity HflC (stomatin/prohibitin superfamily)
MFGLPIRKTVDGVMSAFTRAIADLSVVEEEQRQLQASKTEQAEILSAEADAAAAEAHRAARIRSRLESIVEADTPNDDSGNFATVGV